MSVIVAFSLVKVTVEPQPVVTDTDQADSVVPTTSFPFFLVGSLYLANSTSVVLQILFKKSASSVVKLWGILSQPLMGGARSEERRVGKECRCWWWPYQYR